MKGKVALTKSTTKAYVSFSFSLSAVVSLALYRFLYRQWNVFHFFSKNNSLSKTFLVKCVRSGTALAAIKGGNFGVKLKHLCGFWLDVSFFSHVKIIVHNSDWTYHFFTCENNHSLLWLARTNLRTKIYDKAFWWAFLSMYIVITNDQRPLHEYVLILMETLNCHIYCTIHKVCISFQITLRFFLGLSASTIHMQKSVFSSSNNASIVFPPCVSWSRWREGWCLTRESLSTLHPVS